jgi:hypothetical protein
MQPRCVILSEWQPIDFQRAPSVAAKRAHETAILAAARVLGAQLGIRQVTVTDIAKAVGYAQVGAAALLRDA